MSVDTEVWLRRTDRLTAALDTVASSWDHDEGESVLQGEGWQLLVGEPEEGDPTDADPVLADALDGSEVVVYITLEPIGAPSEGFGALSRTVTELVRACGGAALHPETAEVITAP